MRRIVFTVLTLSRLAAWGQSGEIPGRDLLTFPVGLMAEAPALGTIAGTGLWNPATALLPDGFHWRLSAAAMNAPLDIAVAAQLFSVAAEWRRTTFGLRVTRAWVSNMLRNAGYNIDVAREDGVNGLAPPYQFSLSSLLK